MALKVEVFYSLRSPYCYLLTPRLVALERDFDTAVLIRPVYPIAVRDPGFFKRVDPLYRPYHLMDAARVADYLGVPYRRPVPDPIVQDLETSAIAAEQPYIRRVTRLAQAATMVGKGLPFVAEVMTLLWDGHTDGWHVGAHLEQACARAGLELAALDRAIEAEPVNYDALIETNQQDQRAAGHWGVPLMVFDGEPFYGQDRFDMLLWRMKQRGLAARS